MNAQHKFFLKNCSSSLWTRLHHMVILSSQNKITDFLLILAWASPFKPVSTGYPVSTVKPVSTEDAGSTVKPVSTEDPGSGEHPEGSSSGDDTEYFTWP